MVKRDKKVKTINNCDSKITVDSIGLFTWGFGMHFLIEFNKKLYQWSDPAYRGDNTIRPFTGNPKDFAMPGHAGRDKGKHRIGDYCGADVKFIDC